MPHFIVEYSRELETQVQPAKVMEKTNEIAARSGVFGVDDIKVRMQPVELGLVGGKPVPQLHVTVYLLSGRDKATKKVLTEALVEGLSSYVSTAESVSANTIDMDRETYSKFVR